MPQSKSPAYAARVNIVKKVKVGWEWKTLSVVRDDKGRIRWDYVLVNGQPDHHPEGTYYLDYYDDGRRKREAAGGTANEVLEQARRKALLLESRDAGLDVKDVDSPEHRLVTAAIEKFLISRMPPRCRPRTHLAYKKTMERFQERCTRRFVRQITRDDMLDYMAYAKSLGLCNRTISDDCVRIATFLKESGAPRLLTRADWPKYTIKEPEIYTPEELAAFFAGCEFKELVLYQFFLLTGFRDMETMYVAWPDINFADQIVRVSAKPDLGFEPKNWEEREVPVPKNLIEMLSMWRSMNTPDAYLVFGTSGGKANTHMLEKCKRIAYGNGLNCGRCHTKKDNLCSEGPYCENYYLHKFRHTFATTHLRDGIDIRTVQMWMGHKDLESTLIYLKPARGKEIQKKVDAGSLAAWTRLPAPQEQAKEKAKVITV